MYLIDGSLIEKSLSIFYKGSVIEKTCVVDKKV